MKIRCSLCGKAKPRSQFRRIKPSAYCRACYKARWETVKDSLDPTAGQYAKTVALYIREGLIKTPLDDAYLRSADKG